MHFFLPFSVEPGGPHGDVVGGPHAARGPQVARDCPIPYLFFLTVNGHKIL